MTERIADLILFGVRSPIAAEYEETCVRSAINIVACVNINGAPRVFSTERLVELADFDCLGASAPFMPCAFLPARREELTVMGVSRGLELAGALVDPYAIVASSVQVGDGSFINAGAVIGAVSLLGRGVLVNRAASIGHHAVLGDFVSVGPGATLAGNVRVESSALIGAGAVVLPNLRIGAGAVVAAGSVVRRNVPEGATAAGNPAVLRRYDPKRGSLNAEDEE